MRLFALAVTAVVLMAAGVLYASSAQRAVAVEHATEERATQQVLVLVNGLDATLSAYASTGDTEALRHRDELTTDLHATLRDLRERSADARTETRAVAYQSRLVGLYLGAVDGDLAAARPRATLTGDAEFRHRIVDDITAANVALRDQQEPVVAAEDRAAALHAPITILVLSILFGAAAAVMVRRGRRVEGRRTDDRLRQGRFAEAMQVSDSQGEAHLLLKRHLELAIPGVDVTVLNRNNSADRLEASTTLPGDSPLLDVLEHARPRACLSVRLSRPFVQGSADDEVLACEVCGVLPGATTCQPLLVGGEVIGSVLAEHDGPLPARESEIIAGSVGQAAPVLTNLRNLAIAETRAATDALTGLPNRRAIDDTLLRLLAQAGRSFDPLSAILLDLDHFKLINDTYGHDRGDEVLAAFAARLGEVVRTSDFAGRNGGEEFVLLLPDTDRTGAVRLAEKVREVMRGLTVPGVDRPITASFGIACFPDDAVEAEALMRSADRALYAAKRGGRDRIEASSTGMAPVDDALPAS